MIRKFSMVGEYHKVRGLRNQDVVVSDENDEVEVIILSDGVSLCPEGLRGAEVTCEAVRRLITKKGSFFLAFDDRSKIEFMMAHIEYELKLQAQKMSRCVEDYSATISYAVLDKKRGKVFLSNLGDAMIIGYYERGCELLINPSDSLSGTFVNTNRRAVDYTNTRCVDWKDYEGIIIISDGAWRLLYDGGRIKQDIKLMLKNGDFRAINKYLETNLPADDCSYICMMRGEEERESYC